MMYPSIDKEYKNDGSIQQSLKIECKTDASIMLKDPPAQMDPSRSNMIEILRDIEWYQNNFRTTFHMTDAPLGHIKVLIPQQLLYDDRQSYPMWKNVSDIGLGGPLPHIIRFILVFIFNVPMVKKINTVPAHLYQNGFLPQDAFSVAIYSNKLLGYYDLVYEAKTLSITFGSSTEFEFAQVGFIQVTH